MNRYSKLTAAELEAKRQELLAQREESIRRQATMHACKSAIGVRDWANEEYRLNGELMALNDVIFNG